jgi:hypothetical protein
VDATRRPGARMSAVSATGGRRMSALFLLATLSPACLTGGSDRRGPRVEPANLITTSRQAESGFSTKIVGIDDIPINMSRELVLRPGRHTVYVEGTFAPPLRVGGVAVGAVLISPILAPAIVAGVAAAESANRTVQTSGRLKACFIARPGRTYEVRTYAEGGVWNVQVVDETTTYDVKSPCKDPVAPIPLTGGPKQPRDPFD